jgi:hypothetical protein
MGTNSAYEYHEAKINNQPCKVCFNRVSALNISGLIVAPINLFSLGNPVHYLATITGTLSTKTITISRNATATYTAHRTLLDCSRHAVGLARFYSHWPIWFCHGTLLATSQSPLSISSLGSKADTSWSKKVAVFSRRIIDLQNQRLLSLRNVAFCSRLGQSSSIGFPVLNTLRSSFSLCI